MTSPHSTSGHQFYLYVRTHDTAAISLTLFVPSVVYCRLMHEQKLSASSGNRSSHLSITELKISGEPVEKLFLWGQSACALTVGGEQQVLTFGGFGGPGRHSRRNYSLLLDPTSGLLKEINVKDSPSSRMGHTTTAVDNHIYAVGGRAGPSEILDDVWVLQSTENRWSRVECSGDIFHPRYCRHEIPDDYTKLG